MTCSNYISICACWFSILILLTGNMVCIFCVWKDVQYLENHKETKLLVRLSFKIEEIERQPNQHFG